jgi:hypothetical protein
VQRPEKPFYIVEFHRLLRSTHCSVCTEMPIACCRKRLIGHMNSSIPFSLISLCTQPLTGLGLRDWRDIDYPSYLEQASHVLGPIPIIGL